MVRMGGVGVARARAAGSVIVIRTCVSCVFFGVGGRSNGHNTVKPGTAQQDTVWHSASTYPISGNVAVVPPNGPWGVPSLDIPRWCKAMTRLGLCVLVRGVAVHVTYAGV